MSEIYPVVAGSNGFSQVSNIAPATDSAAAAPQGWMQISAENSAQPVVSANELTSLSALITYVAGKLGTSEFRIERNLSDKFNIPNAKLLPANQFDLACRFLSDSIAA